jgi:hypothetical protein
MTHEPDTEEKKLKVSVCQSCNGWVRAAALDYFKTSTKARNEFMREVAKYNLAVREIPLTEWQQLKMPTCNCPLK